MEYKDGNKPLDKKVEERMDLLQMQMESNLHLVNENQVLSTVYSITKFWSILSEEDRDYVQAAHDAIHSKSRWG